MSLRDEIGNTEEESALKKSRDQFARQNQHLLEKVAELEKVLGIVERVENTEENVKMLAEKVIKGGSGVWGAVPMTPHPQISQEDAEAMVKYVLLLKK